VILINSKSRSRAYFVLCAVIPLLCATSHAHEDKYSDAKYVPPAGKVLHIAGQTREDFSHYVDKVSEHGEAIGLPAGFAYYVSLGTLERLHKPHPVVPGDYHQDLDYHLARDWPMVPQFALDLTPEILNKVPTGEMDKEIDVLGATLKAIDRPIYFRIGYEFDGSHNQYDPEPYKATYRHIADRFRRNGVDNLAYVWHSYAMKPTHGGHDVMAWYPGDAYVDWVGVSFFFHHIEGHSFFTAINRQRLVDIAEEKAKPLMICEASAWRPVEHQRNISGKAYWDFWYKPFFEFVEKNDCVRAISIIHTNGDARSLWVVRHLSNGRLTDDPVIFKRWRMKLGHSRYLNSSAGLYKILGYDTK
jgi:hypothetical protein